MMMSICAKRRVNWHGEGRVGKGNLCNQRAVHPGYLWAIKILIDTWVLREFSEVDGAVRLV